MIKNRSVATIDGPEFIDVKPFNPLISQCTIKVMYIGKNRNGSFIDKNTAIQMANSLPGTPIVAAYREDVEDFGDHGHVITIEDGEVKFACKTVPYGFVAPDARVWFQKFIDTDEFGNETEHEYMMTTGYLWTGQFPEAKKVIEEGQPQSMELDDESLDGHWANDSESGMDFFIINDAMFSKLCILGDDVEPCFEGASVTDVDADFSIEKDFARTLYSMIKELQDAIGNSEGGLNMPKDFTVTSEGEEVETVEEAVEVEAPAEVEAPVEVEETQPAEEEEVEVEPEAPAAEEEVEVETEHTIVDDADSETSEEFVDKKKEEEEDSASASDEQEEEDVPTEEDEEDKKKKAVVDNKKKRCSLEDSEERLSALEAELEELRAFKLSVEREKKQAVIDKYHMLSDEEKSSVVSHMDEYSLEQIDEKLALIYVRNNVDFNTVDGHPVEQESAPREGILSFSLDNDVDNTEAVDDVQQILRDLRNNY